MPYEEEKSIDVKYDEEKIGVYRPDFVVDGKIVVELKALPSVGKFEKAQTWHYLKATDYHLALLVNFGRADATIERIIHGYQTTQEDGSPSKSVSSQRKSVFMPHFLSMSATPIPRTLMMTVFGDLDVSLITELPTGRRPIETKIVKPHERNDAYEFMRKEVQAGRQVFVICPRITQNDAELTQNNAEGSLPHHSASVPRNSALTVEMTAVEDEYKKLSKQIFPELKVAMLHGKMKPKEKESVMRDFKDGKTDILVATSVIEVGVDIPNATVMAIEGADRFGLAQLYQFRGRVGRGEHQSHCLLFTDSEGDSVKARLSAIMSAKNGFELAEKDLAIREPGEFFGEAQSGFSDAAIEALRDPELVKMSREAAAETLQHDPAIRAYPPLRDRLAAFRKTLHME